MLKVLYYNWTDYRSPRGGGVTVYLRNLLTAISGSEQISPVFLSSGDIYNPFSSQPYIRAVRNQTNPCCPAFELINSPVPAPGSRLFQNLHNYLNMSDTTILELLRDFIINQGGFDVIHFHNLEGLPLNVLKIKEYFPQIKIVFTLHNYYPFCSQVQLFQYHNECRCQSFLGGLECGKCCHKDINPEVFVEPMVHWFISGSIWPKLLTFWLKYKSRRLVRHLLSAEIQSNSPQTFKDFRRLNISYLNRYADKVLAVSQRVCEIAENYGINPQLLEVAYIGTDYAGPVSMPKINFSKGKKDFTIAFLGYARAAKGFFFLISALEKLPEKVAARINLRLAARYINDVFDSGRLKNLQQKFRRVEIYDGYQREDLPKLLSDVDLGIVPVIWEDNLPQVALEMAVHGVAVLASDFGGASELSASQYFRFKGSDQQDFIEHLLYILAHREVLSDYHQQLSPLTTMSQHIEQLLKLYLSSKPKIFQIAS